MLTRACLCCCVGQVSVYAVPGASVCLSSLPSYPGYKPTCQYHIRLNRSHMACLCCCGGQVSVQLSPGSLCVSAAGDELLRGPLYAEVKVEDSTWFCGESYWGFAASTMKHRVGCY